MANPTLAVLLRNGHHIDASVRYALKCNDIAVSYARTPIQIPIAQASPELIDLGFVRPSLTITGIVDTLGGDLTNVGSGDDAGFGGMEKFMYQRIKTSITSGTGKYNDGGTNSALDLAYYIPYKNALEEAVGSWIYLTGDTPLQVEIGDAQFPAGYGGYIKHSDTAKNVSRYVNSGSNNTTHTTGGAIYDVAIQQGRFSLQAAREDRYDFTLQFVIKRRIDIP